MGGRSCKVQPKPPERSKRSSQGGYRHKAQSLNTGAQRLENSSNFTHQEKEKSKREYVSAGSDGIGRAATSRVQPDLKTDCNQQSGMTLSDAGTMQDNKQNNCDPAATFSVATKSSAHKPSGSSENII